MRLKGKTALISGAGRNNGKAIALTFAREGADVILIARKRGDDLKQVASECESHGVKTLSLLADVSKSDEVNRVVKHGLERFGKVDVLMSVTGLRPHKPFWDYTDDEWDTVFAVNVKSTFYLARALAPSMMDRRSGSIIALGGMASLTAQVNNGVGVTSKHALYGLIKALAIELGPYGVRANIVNPGHIKNVRLNPEWYADTGGDPFTSEERARTPLGHEGTSQDVANAALFLASDESSYITGDRIVCTGGRYM